MRNNRASNYLRQKLTDLQGNTDESTITVGDFNIASSETDPEVEKSVRTQLNPTTLYYIHQSTGYN